MKFIELNVRHHIQRGNVVKVKGFNKPQIVLRRQRDRVWVKDYEEGARVEAHRRSRPGQDHFRSGREIREGDITHAATR